MNSFYKFSTLCTLVAIQPVSLDVSVQARNVMESDEQLWSVVHGRSSLPSQIRDRTNKL